MGESSVISTLFASITEVVNSIMTLFGTVATTLLNNVLVQIVLGIIVLGIVISLVMYFIRKIKRRG